MTTFTDLCPKSDVELTPIIDKAMETALRFMEEGRSSVTDEDYNIFFLALSYFLEPRTAPCWESYPLRLATKPMHCAVLTENPREALDKLRAALWIVENLGDQEELPAALPEYRDKDIVHLRKMLAYWRSSKMSTAWNGTAKIRSKNTLRAQENKN
jgi:hypothetical protein